MPSIRIELDVEVTPWTAQRLVEEAGLDPDDAEECEDVPSSDIAYCLTSILNWEETKAEAFAGSCLFYDIGEVTLVRSALNPEPGS